MTLLHGTGLIYEGKGLLIMGPSGSGKSDLALRMMGRGALLIGDDYIEVSSAEGGRVIMRAPKNIAGKIEVHNVGLLEVAFQSQAEIDMVFHLVTSVQKLERLPFEKMISIEGCRIPCLDFYAFEASAPDKIRAALTIFSGKY